MASILRSIKLLRSLNVCFRHLNNQPNVIFTEGMRCSHRLLSTQTVAETAVEDKYSNTISLHSMDKMLFQLDTDVRRMGRITRKDVENVFSKIRTIGHVTSIQSLVLLRCCGALLPEEKQANRTELVNSIWNKLLELDCKLDVSHYNALLKVYLDNEYKFSPIDFLADMERKGIEPNRVTYQRFIGRYCQDGDIEGASKILEFMKSKNLSINETVFKFLVMGYSKSKDMENAKNILEVMKNAQLEPTAETYAALACGYAESGDIKGIVDTLKQAEENDVILLHKNYLDIIFHLAVNGHSGYVDQISSKMRKLAGYNQDCINVILELINRGFDDVGYKILFTMVPPVDVAAQDKIGNFFIKQLVHMKRPIEKIIEVCRDLKSKGMNESGLLKATETALQFQNTEYANTLLKEMHKEGHPIRCHYFWPILLYHRKQNDENAIYKMLETMEELGCSANFETILDYVLPGINTVDSDIVIDKLKNIVKQPVDAIIVPLIRFYLLSSEIDKVKELVEKYPVRLPSSLSRPLAQAYRSGINTPTVLEILKYLIENPEIQINQNTRNDVAGQFLLDYLSVSENNTQGLSELLQGIVKLNLNISQSASDSIKMRLRSDISDEASKLLEQIATSDSLLETRIEYSPFIPHPRNMNIDELENHLTELKNKDMNPRGVLRRLLMLHCREKNLERVVELKEEFDSQNLNYTPSLYALLMDMYSYHDKIEDALHYYSLLQENFPEFRIDTHKVINLATLFVKNDRFEDAVKTIESYHARFGTDVEVRKNYMEGNIYRLLMACAEKQNVEYTEKIFDLLVMKCHYSQPMNFVLGPLVKVHLARDDFNKAFEVFVKCAKTYNQTPFKGEICKQLIELEDSERLQQVVDLSTTIHGELNTLYDLACAFIEMDKVRQARKVFDTPGLRAHHKKIEAVCEKYVDQNMVTELKHFINVTKDIFAIDRDRMYYHLIRAYAKQNAVQKALDVLTIMEEENIQPSAKTLSFLGEFLKKSNETVPFQIPVLPTDVSEETTALLERIQGEDADRALEIKRNLNNQGIKISTSVLSSLIELLINKDRLLEANNLMHELLHQKLYPQRHIMKHLLYQFAKAGDVEAVEALRNLLPIRVQRDVSYENMLCNAYVNSGRHLELLEELEQDTSKSKFVFPAGGMLGILQNLPQLEERVVQLAERYYKDENFCIPKNIIWSHYLMQENYKKADEVFQSCPEMKEKLLFGSVLTKIKSTVNETMARKLIEVVKLCNMSSKSIGAALSGLIHVLIENRKVDEALSVFEESQASGLQVTDFYHSTLLKLADELRSVNKPVPFIVPVGQSRRQADSSDDE